MSVCLSVSIKYSFLITCLHLLYYYYSHLINNDNKNICEKLMQKQNIIAYKILSCRAQRVQKKKNKINGDEYHRLIIQLNNNNNKHSHRHNYIV